VNHAPRPRSSPAIAAVLARAAPARLAAEPRAPRRANPSATPGTTCSPSPGWRLPGLEAAWAETQRYIVGIRDLARARGRPSCWPRIPAHQVSAIAPAEGRQRPGSAWSHASEAPSHPGGPGPTRGIPGHQSPLAFQSGHRGTGAGRNRAALLAAGHPLDAGGGPGLRHGPPGGPAASGAPSRVSAVSGPPPRRHRSIR
jgi:hypothetical protein